MGTGRKHFELEQFYFWKHTSFKLQLLSFLPIQFSNMPWNYNIWVFSLHARNITLQVLENYVYIRK